MKLFDLFATLTLDSSKFERGLTDASNRLNSTASSIKSFGQSAMGSMNGLVSALAKVASAAALIKAGEYVVKTGVTYTAALEEYEAQLSVLLGGAEAASAAMEDLAEMAAKTPYELKDVADSATTLLTVGVGSDEVTDYVRRLGDISLGSSEKLDALTSAFAKTKSQGKLTTEVLRSMQFNGFDPLRMIAEKYNLTQDAVNQALSDGVIPVEELEWAIKKATDEGGQFFNGSATLAETLNGKIGTLSENWQAFLGKLVEPVSESLSNTVLPYAINLVDELTTALDENGIQGVLSTVQTKVNELCGSIITKIKDYFDSEDAAADLASVLNSIASGIGGASVTFSNVLAIATSLITGVASSLTTEEGISGLKDIVVAIGTGIVNLGVEVIKALPEIASAALQVATALVDAIAASLPDLGSSIISGFTALFTPEEQTTLQTQLEATGTAVENLLADVATAQSTYDASISSIESRAELANGYLATIQALEEKDTLTDAEYETWQAAVDALTRMYPELSEKVSAETGLFKDNAESIRGTITALNDLAATKAMSDILSGLESSAAGFVSTMVEANALLTDVNTQAAENQTQLDYFNSHLKADTGHSGASYFSENGLATLNATQTKFLEQFEAGRALLDEMGGLYTMGMDGVATLNVPENGDLDGAANAVQNALTEIETELAAKQTELEAARSEAQSQIDEAQTQIDALSEKKDTLMNSYKELFANVKENAETAGTTADELGTLYEAANEQANAAMLSVSGLVDAWAQVPEEKKTVYTIEGLPSTDNSPVGKVLSPLVPHATGLYSVPYDNYAALLHKGEQVLTRAQADEYRRGGTAAASSQNFVINIQSTAESPSETAAYIRQAMRNLRFT